MLATVEWGRVRSAAELDERRPPAMLAGFCPRNSSNRGQQNKPPYSRNRCGFLARRDSGETASRLSRLFLFWRGTPPQNRSDSRAASEYSAHVIETMTSANGPFTFTAHRRACPERASKSPLSTHDDNANALTQRKRIGQKMLEIGDTANVTLLTNGSPRKHFDELIR